MRDLLELVSALADFLHSLPLPVLCLLCLALGLLLYALVESDNGLD